MLICSACGSAGRRRPRTFLERLVNRAKVKCSNCGDVWYWRRYLFQPYTRCPECGTARLSKLSKYDQIDRRTKNVYRRFLAIFGAPIYHCTFCRLQFRDVHKLDPERPAKVRISV